MKLNAKVLFSEKFSFDGKSFVKIQALCNGKGIFQQTVREELVPDSIEGKEVNFVYDIGFDSKLKPYLKFNGLEIL